MPRFPLQLVSLGAGVAGLSLLLTVVSSSATRANPPSRFVVAPTQRAAGVMAPRAPTVRRRATGSGRSRSYSVAPSPCPTNFSATGQYFDGTPNGSSDVAGGDYTAVLAGAYNKACDTESAIGGGANNEIGYDSGAYDSFIGAGLGNVITANYGFVGSGEYNEAAGSATFIGTGFNGLASGSGSFVGGGGFESEELVSPGHGNVTAGQDAFVGAGDLNQISSDGNGSFIGGGGYSVASNGGTTSNSVTAPDAFLGAGDSNTIRGSYAFIGAGTSNLAIATSAFVGSGGNNVAEGGSSFVGAGSGNVALGANSFVGAGDGEVDNVQGNVGSGNVAAATDSFVGSGDLNIIESTGSGSFIGGGGYTYAANGGDATSSVIYSADSFIGAGDQNAINGAESFIGSGGNNTIGSSASYASVIGGNRNTANGEYASVIGGYGNVASGAYGIVAGGDTSTAAGTVSFAAGYHADAAHNGSFVWSDYVSGSSSIKDTAANQFVVRASGGTYVYSDEGATSGVKLAAGSGTWASLSDRHAKTGIVPLDDAAILAKVDALPLSAWSYKTESGVRHVGPMAQDFYSAFGVGEDNRHITSIDEDGVALAAIKALHKENARLRRENARLSSVVTSVRADQRRLDAIVAGLVRKDR